MDLNEENVLWVATQCRDHSRDFIVSRQTLRHFNGNVTNCHEHSLVFREFLIQYKAEEFEDRSPNFCVTRACMSYSNYYVGPSSLFTSELFEHFTQISRDLIDNVRENTYRVMTAHAYFLITKQGDDFFVGIHKLESLSKTMLQWQRGLIFNRICELEEIDHNSTLENLRDLIRKHKTEEITLTDFDKILKSYYLEQFLRGFKTKELKIEISKCPNLLKGVKKDFMSDIQDKKFVSIEGVMLTTIDNINFNTINLIAKVVEDRSEYSSNTRGFLRGKTNVNLLTVTSAFKEWMSEQQQPNKGLIKE
jgi:hypothetical protein